jgi:asparagine synthase (glutamine-hydrolysing)
VGNSDKSLLEKMCASIRHRGPDSIDYYVDDQVCLGIDRLKIIDLVKGDQPIHNEDGSIWIVFNGEVYNYRDLRLALEGKGHRFYTDSDTETIVHAFEEWGDACVSRLRGMFAFAVWDTKRRRLYFARDRFGKKPLFYRLTASGFYFSSEIKGLLQDDSQPRTMSQEALDYFFTYMYIPSPLSIFEGIRKLPPGHYGTYESGQLTLTQYWDFPSTPKQEMEESWLVEELYRAIVDAVRVRMRSDVPLGAFLSGGIDSSTVVSVMSKLSEIPVKTVSIGFDEGLSETKHSRQVAEFLGTDHREHIVTPDAKTILPSLVWSFDEPFADHSLIPTYYLSRVTRKNVTVALSGDGGDEMFMGYPFLREPTYFGLYARIPRPIRRRVMGLIRAIPIDSGFRKLANHAYEKNYGDQSPAERFAIRMSMYDREGLQGLYSQALAASRAPSDTLSYVTSLVERSNSGDFMDATSYATVRSYLEEDILVKVDRMSMANSLEVRSPLLDQDLASLAGQIPSKLKMKGATTKYILKKMVISKGLLPREIALRKKQGFGAPVESWMRKDWKEFLIQVLDPVITGNYTRLFDAERVRRLLVEPYLNSSKLFALMVFVLWYRMYIDEHAMAAPVTPDALAR